jgi:hypothetical protein
MNKSNDGTDILSMFGLTEKQTRILFSIEKLLIEADIKNSKNDKEVKGKWLLDWSLSLTTSLTELNPNEPYDFMTQSEIMDTIAMEHTANINNTWYYLIMLEATLFVPYTPLGKNKKDDGLYKKLKYKEQMETLKGLVKANEIMDEVFVDRFKKTYAKSLSKITGKVTKIALRVVSVVAIAAIIAATAGALAGPIAVAIFGPAFAGLNGAALVAACLAMAGGGAIAVGGGGMAGGALVIVGGGALLGLAGGGAAVGGVALFVTSIPELTLTQAAKLEVVLKEITINAQQDIKFAQSVLENCLNQIANLHAHLAKMKLDQLEDKKTIANMEKSITYMERAYDDTRKFVSSYTIGADFQE